MAKTEAMMGDSLALTISQPNQPTVESNNITSLNPKLALRAYQEESLSQVDKAYREGKNRLLVSLPTGTGKTVVFCHLVARTKGRSLIIAHREELLEQAASKIKMLLPNTTIGVVKAEQNQVDSQIVVASIQTLAREKRLAQLGNNFSTIIIDEAHHAAATSYTNVLKSLGCFNKENPPLTLGVTATPERGDKVGLDKVFQEIVYHRNLLEMIGEQYLSDLTWNKIDLNVNLDSVGTSKGDFIESQLIKALSNTNLPAHILSAFQLYATDRKTIVFVPGVALAKETAKLFKQFGVACESIDGKLSSDERKAILARLASGETQVVVNCLILTEGFDEPTIDCIIFARPTKSKSFYLQMLGRGTRLHPGKQDCLVLDLVGITQKHKLVTLPNLFGLSEYKLKSKSVLSAHQEEVARQAKLKAQAEAKALENPNHAKPAQNQTSVEAPAKEEKIVKFNWLKVSDTRYALSMGQGIIFLIKQPNSHDKWLTLLSEPDKTKTLLAKDLVIDYAQGVAEDHVRKLKALALIDVDAAWRNRPPSEKQLDLMKNLEIEFPSDVTKGQASDLITLYFANQDLSIDKFVFDNTQSLQAQSQTTTHTGNNNNSTLTSVPDKASSIITPNASISKTSAVEPEVSNKVLPFPQKESHNEPKTSYIPAFAKYCFALNIEHLKIYDTYNLNSYTPKGQNGSQSRSSQRNALSIAQSYLADYFNQEVGIIFAGKANVGKTHLAIGVLRQLTIEYKIPTFFCDCHAITKYLVKQGYQKTLDKLTQILDKSEVILLDNLSFNSPNKKIKDIFCELIDYSYKNEKKLIITTKHLNHSATTYYEQNAITDLSLGDVLGIDCSSLLYQQCVYTEIVAGEANQNLSLPTTPTENTVSSPSPSTNKPKSSFSSIADIVSNFFAQIRPKN